MNQSTVLAQGCVATVHTGWLAGKPVAWKVFPARFDRRTLAAVQRDRCRLGGLSAPILPVDGVERWDGRHALRMELCVESLAARIRRTGPLPGWEVVALGHALARALAAAHRVGVLHGAVNPDNVLFRASGEPVLADFGVVLREAFPRDSMHGIDFVSPETLRTGTVTEHSDLYGLGAVLHVALTGGSPHPGRLGERPGERVLRVLGAPVPKISRPDVPAGLATVTARLLAGETTDPPADAGWAVTQLAGLLPRNATGDTERLPVPPPAGRPPAGRRRGRFVVVGVAVLVVLAIVLALGLRHDRPDGQATPAAPPVVAGIELATPQDFGDHVVLTWTSPRTLEFVVVVRSDGQPNRYLLVDGNHTTTVPVDPARGYCFLVRGTDGSQVYASKPAGIRGADCPE